jgi:hypothetical protein
MSTCKGSTVVVGAALLIMGGTIDSNGDLILGYRNYRVKKHDSGKVSIIPTDEPIEL